MRRINNTFGREFFQSIKFWISNSPKRTYYETLQLSPEASAEEIKNNYYRLAKEYHPDKNPRHSEQFKLVSEAYNTLKDPAKRKIYDQEQLYFTKYYSDTHDKTSRTKNHSRSDHHYGYQQGKTQQQRNRYYENPYSSSENYNFNPNQSQKKYQDFIREANRKSEMYAKMEKGTVKSPNEINERIRRAFIFGMGLASVIIVAELIFKIYQFNSLQRRRSYYERLDPRDLY